MTTLETLLAKQAITEQIYRYCRAMDRIDNALGASIWHTDGKADYGPIFQGSGAGFVEWVAGSHAGMISTSHQISNILIEVDGDRATSEAYVTAALRFDAEGVLTEMSSRGRYLDRWSCRDGRWAIDLRRYVHDFSDTRVVGPDHLPGWSRRDHGDPSYAAA